MFLASEEISEWRADAVMFKDRVTIQNLVEKLETKNVKNQVSSEISLTGCSNHLHAVRTDVVLQKEIPEL